MSESNSAPCDDLEKRDALSARWDKVAFRAQGSPFEDLTLAGLAKNTGVRAWSRPGGKVKGDTVARYIYLTFEELLEVEHLDLKTAEHLIEICETTFLFEAECDDLGSFEEIDTQANAQRMRFVEEYGIYQDYPVRLANLGADLHELCQAEEIITFVDLMEFLDKLADKAWIGGSYKNLQNVFAHGDEKGLSKYFPYRKGHRGFHLPEALAFCLNRLSRHELQMVYEYHERRRKRSRLMGKALELPHVVGKKLLPEIFDCLHYFSQRQPRLPIRLHDSAYKARELMFLNDPQTEGVLHWLLHLSMACLLPSLAGESDLNQEIEKITLPDDSESIDDLREMIRDSKPQSN
ncbi:MAG TPA: hypothetical protein DCX06_11795 [Opitutae bacterium]|nr:hypothetical protein [Opitutae bacterium]